MKTEQNEKSNLFFEKMQFELDKKPILPEKFLGAEQSTIFGENFCPILAPAIFR